MRMVAIICFAVSLAGATAHASDIASAIADLNVVAKAQVKWNVAKARRADVTCDGAADTIIFGTTNGRVWVGIVPGGSGQPQVRQFLAAGNSQDAFFGPPIAIKITPLDCLSDEGPLDGCRQISRCKEFAVDDGETDPFNFYWDDRQKTIRWWRN